MLHILLVMLVSLPCVVEGGSRECTSTAGAEFDLRRPFGLDLFLLLE